MNKPTAVEVSAYAQSIGFTKLDGDYFVDYWTARGWLVKPGISMRDWKAAVRNWKRMDWGQPGGATANGGDSQHRARAEREAYLKEYAEQIEACRSWRRNPDQAPMGNPWDVESKIWTKAKRNFGAPFLEELKRRVNGGAKRAQIAQAGLGGIDTRVGGISRDRGASRTPNGDVEGQSDE